MNKENAIKVVKEKLSVDFAEAANIVEKGSCGR